MYVDEDSAVFHVMADILPSWRMKLPVYKVGNMLAPAIEKEFQTLTSR